MKTRGIVTVAVLTAVGAVAAGAAGTLWVSQHQGVLSTISFGAHGAHQQTARAADDAAGADAAETDTRAYKYVSLEKVIVMLRKESGERDEHYMSVDLVFPTPVANEAITKDQLPLLRSVAVQTLSQLTLEAADHATVDELGVRINQALDQTYAHDRSGKPFAEARIAKLIVE